MASSYLSAAIKVCARLYAMAGLRKFPHISVPHNTATTAAAAIQISFFDFFLVFGAGSGFGSGSFGSGFFTSG